MDDLEWPLLNGGLERRVVDVSRSWEPAQPLARPVIGEATKVHNDDLVRHFRQPI